MNEIDKQMSRRNRRRIRRRLRLRRKNEAAVLKSMRQGLLGRMGETLLHIQAAERQLQICISYFMPDEKCKTVEEVEAQAVADRKKTLGQLLTLMRKRIKISELFDKELDQFVGDRNALAHRFLAIEGVNLTSVEGLQNAAKFLEGIKAQAIHVRKTMHGLMKAIGDEQPSTEEEGEYIKLAKIIFGGDESSSENS